MEVLWASMGSAPAYEIFTGCAEVAGGLLLIVPRTAILGLISCACMIQVFVLDMTYDGPVKLFVFHLILLSCFLLAPDVPRMVRFLLSLSTEAQLFRSVRANRIALAAQIIFGLWLVGMNFQDCWSFPPLRQLVCPAVNCIFRHTVCLSENFFLIPRQTS